MSLRSLGPGQGLVPSTEGAPTQIVLAFDDNRHASVLFGQYGQITTDATTGVKTKNAQVGARVPVGATA